MRTGVPCNENRFFPVKKTYREFPVSLTGYGFAVIACTLNVRMANVVADHKDLITQ